MKTKNWQKEGNRLTKVIIEVEADEISEHLM